MSLCIIVEGWHKTNFYGVAKDNLRATGSVEVIRNCHEYGIVVVTFPLGYQTNHYMKPCAALQIINLVKEVRVKSLWLEGD